MLLPRFKALATGMVVAIAVMSTGLAIVADASTSIGKFRIADFNPATKQGTAHCFRGYAFKTPSTEVRVVGLVGGGHQTYIEGSRDFRGAIFSTAELHDGKAAKVGDMLVEVRFKGAEANQEVLFASAEADELLSRTGLSDDDVLTLAADTWYFLMQGRITGSVLHHYIEDLDPAEVIADSAIIADWLPLTNEAFFGPCTPSSSSANEGRTVPTSVLPGNPATGTAFTLTADKPAVGFLFETAAGTVTATVETLEAPFGFALTALGGAATTLSMEVSENADMSGLVLRTIASLYDGVPFSEAPAAVTAGGNVTFTYSTGASISLPVPGSGEKTYYYRIRAVNSAGQSVGSTIQSVTLTTEGLDSAGSVTVEDAPPPPPPPPPAAPSPITDPGGGVPVVAPGGSTGSVGGVPVAPTPSRPSGGSAEFRVGTVETRVDVASSGAGAVAGSDGAPVIRAVRDRVATVSGGGMRPGGIAEVWMPLPNGGSRQVALLPIAADGTFDGALPFTGELDGRGPLPIGDRTIQLFGRAADGQLTVINFGVRIEQPDPLTPEPDRDRGAVPTLTRGQSLATNAGLPTPVTVTPLPEARSTRIEGDGWLMDVDVPDGEVLDDGGAPLIEIVNGTDSRVRGTGFMAGTRAYVWLMSDPTFLGEVIVNADGSFSGSVPIAGVEPGEHTLQLSGVGTDGFIRAANLGVVLVGDGMPRPNRIPAGEGPPYMPGAALLWALGLAGTAFLVRSRVANGAR